jgi:hypothetical protein
MSDQEQTENQYPPQQPSPPPEQAETTATTAPAYGYGYGYQQPQPYQEGPRTDERAIWALVSAIAGFVLCPILLHVVGWVLANQSLKEIRSSGGRLVGDGIASTARVLSIVGLVLYGIGLLIAALVFAILVPLGLLTAGTIATNVEAETRTIAPAEISAIDGQSFDHSAGDITYDLSGLDFTDRSVETRIQMGAGSLTVEVPAEVTVVLDAQVGAGQLNAFDATVDGLGITEDRTFDGDPDGGTLELEIEMGVGDVRLDRVG